jgi:enoyl-CoA hydratase
MVDAHSALQMGLLNHLYEVDELEQKTLELAKIIASKSPHTLKVAKACVRAALEKPMHQGLEEEAIAFAGLFDSEDKEIGVKAFMERTQAEWVGK